MTICQISLGFQGYTENTNKLTPIRHKPTVSYINPIEVEVVVGVGVCREHTCTIDQLHSAQGTFDAKVHHFTKWLSWVVEETGSNEGSIGTLTLGTQVEIVWRRVERPAAKAASHGSNSGDAKEPPKSIAWVVEHLPAADDVADLALLVPSSDDNSKQFEPRLGASWQEIAINPAVSKVSARRQLGAMAGIYMFLRVAWVLPVLMGRTVRNLENNFLTGFKNTAFRAAAVENTTRLLAGHDINLDESQRYALFRRYLTRFLPYVSNRPTHPRSTLC